MGIKAKGVNDCVNKINAMINDVAARKAVRAVQAALIVGTNRASIYTPIDTSTLINSLIREMLPLDNNRISGRAVYTANYALYVADPNNPMKFRRQGAKKDFLNKGFEDEKASIDQVIRKEMQL